VTAPSRVGQVDLVREAHRLLHRAWREGVELNGREVRDELRAAERAAASALGALVVEQMVEEDG
jgi:hypothetical protein